ncbi:MAG: hypothetical protein WCW26_00175 [Candidatus Buchananbacteria bacterium]
MFEAIRGGLALAVTLVVLKLFLPEVAAKLVLLITNVIDILLLAVNQASVANLIH